MTSSEPPPVMTLTKAAPVLAIVLVFYALRFLFEQFWFFGPALAAIYCTSTVNVALGTSITTGIAGQAVAVGCSTVAAVAGAAISEATTAFGNVMAIAIGFLGSLTVWLTIMLTNPRILKERTTVVKFVASGAVSEIPIIGSLPAFEVTILLMYLFQIKKEKMALKKWQEEQKQLQLQERNQKMLEFKQTYASQQIEAENEEQNQEILEFQQAQQEEIPEEVREAA